MARIFNLIISPNFISPLFWDICVISCYLVINLVYLYFMTSKRADKSKIAIVSRFALPIAILVHTVTAWIFGLQIAREGWHSAIMGPLFVASAMDSGLALLLCVLAALKKARLFETSRELMASLAGLLATCIAVDAFFIFCEVLTMAYPGAAGAETLALMTSGPTAPFFWFEIIGCVACAVICLTPALRRNGLLVTASLLAIAGIFCKRVQLLVGGFQITNLADMAPAVNSMSITYADGTLADAYANLVYWPTPLEAGVTLGVVALGFLVFFLGLKFLPLRPSEK